jgi:hypothetical protein
MSALNNVLGQQDDPRKVELIRSLIDKTRQGRIPWTKRASALTAMVPTGVEVNFVLSPISIFTQYSGWQLFTVRDRSGSELVRVENVTSVVSILAGATRGALVEAADDLFKLVNAAAVDKLDRAIDTIKKL